MSFTAIVWVLAGIVLIILSLKRPVWAIAWYMQTFFAAPQNWWWGDQVPSMRYALWAGYILLFAVVVRQATSPPPDNEKMSGAHKIAALMAINATCVHLLFAVDRTISIQVLVELIKFLLLFYLMWKAIRDRSDFRTALMAIAVGAFYIGFEVTINERGDFNGSRLEGVGAPGADTSNSLANLMLVCLPLISSLLIGGKKRHKFVAICAAPLVLNVLLLCNSRGAFLGLVGTALTFLLIARGQTRKRALQAFALGSLALFLLLGDPKILTRFTTTFAGSEDRDTSAQSRLLFWQAGMAQLSDYPFGAGGGSFKFNIGRRYQAQVAGDDNVTDRALHQGYLTEATDWGIQGLILKLGMFWLTLIAAFRTEETCRREGRVNDALTGLCIMTAGIGLAIHCLFGDFLASEWTYWIMALLLRYAEVYKVAEVRTADESVPAVAAA